MSNDISIWYDFVLQQLAAESYLHNFDWTAPSDVILARQKQLLMLGNNPEGYGETSYTRMTSAQADDFLSHYEIIDHLPNDEQSGFSATLMKNKETGEYTLSFRSTEYRQVADGGDFVRDAQGADVDFTQYGFAFAQIKSMEDWVSPKFTDTLLSPNSVFQTLPG